MRRKNHAGGGLAKEAHGRRVLGIPATAVIAIGLAIGVGGQPSIAAAQQQVQQIAVAAGPLSSALNALAAQAGLQIGFDSGLLRGISTTGISGSYTADAALRQLLQGTGLTHAFSGPTTVVVSAANTGAIDSAAFGGDDFTTLAPIVIQGEKFGRDLQDTFASTGVVTAADIENYGIADVSQSLNRMANIRSFGTGTGNTSFVIRGLNADGVTQPSRSAPVISVVVDGAEQGVEATRRGTRGVWDVEQIEVLRGPQSTLRGRNSLAGSVLIKTKDPGWTPELLTQGVVANDDFFSGAAALSLPIIKDQLAIRIAGEAWKSSKDIDHVDPATASLGKDEYQHIRGKILVTPEALPEFRGVFTISHTHDKPGWGLVSGPDFFARRFEDVSEDTAEFRDTRVNRYIADLSYELTPDWTVKSVTSFTDTDLSITTPANSLYIRDDERKNEDLAQDLQFKYESDNSAFSGVFGLFAGRFTNDQDSNLKLWLGRYVDRYFPPYAGLVPPGTIIDYQVLKSENKTESLAAYADMRYRFGDGWTAIAGGRLLYDRVTAHYRGQVVDPAATLGSVLGGGGPVYDSLDENSAVSNTVFLPKIGLAFDISDTQSVALTASRGYRAGFSESVAGSSQINSVDPEYLWSYEFAYRSKWLDDRLHLNANLFYYDYRNQQIVTFNPAFPIQTITLNSAKSHAYGAEIEARFQATQDIELFSSVGLLKTRFDEGDFAQNGASISLRGKRFPEAPTFTASLGGIWRHESGLFAGADLSYTDGYYSSGDLANSAAMHVSGFTLVNAEVGYRTENMTLTAFAKNLFDEQYLTAKLASGTQATIGDGRRFGLRVEGRF